MFGSDRSRFTEAKRSVNDKNLGPLVKTVSVLGGEGCQGVVMGDLRFNLMRTG